MNLREIGTVTTNTGRAIHGSLIVAIVAALWMAFAAPAGAQVDVGACGVYGSQAEAQADLDANPDLAPELDGDGNGIACEGGYASDEPVVVVCNEASGQLIEVSEEAADLGQIDFLYHVATADEIAAGGCAAATPEPDTIALAIFQFNCPNAAAADDVYANCRPGGNGTYQVATADGAVLGSCTTQVGVVRDSEVGYCYVEGVPFDTQLVVTEDESTGFNPLENPKTLTIERPAPGAADFMPTVTFVNLPAADLVTPEPTQAAAPVTPEEGEREMAVTSLPVTGTGTAVESDQAESRLAVLAGMLTVVLVTMLMAAVFGLNARLRGSAK